MSLSTLKPTEWHLLVIHTGGTIGMIRNDENVLVPNGKFQFEKQIRNATLLHDKELEITLRPKPRNQFTALVLPSGSANPARMGERIFYYIYEYDQLLDSSNIVIRDYVRMCEDINKHYENFDGFVILHGTDTLSYTASALSFMLEDLGKPVVLTGSQITIFDPETDGINNFRGALLAAAYMKIPEVCIYFHKKLFRGNRTTKSNANEDDLKGFRTPNMDPLAKMNINSEKFILGTNQLNIKPQLGNFKIFTNICKDVVVLYLTPTLDLKTMKGVLHNDVQGLMLLTYGAGNFPSLHADLLRELKDASNRGVIILNITQCLKGKVKTDYETGLLLEKAGAISGGDMTVEAAHAKLCYVLAKCSTLSDKKMMMQKSLRGEMTEN